MNIAPEWTPPDPPWHLRDPWVCRLNSNRAAWGKAIRGNVPKTSDQAVAWHLSNYGNKDGSRCFPGIGRLVEATCASEKTVKRAIAWLAETGWIRRTGAGNRRRHEADTYQLTLPAPVAVTLGLWGDDSGPQWIERPDGEPRPEVIACTGWLASRLQWEQGSPVTCEADPAGRHGVTDQGSSGTDQGSSGTGSGVTGDPPPGVTRALHHSESSDSAPHADAWGATMISDEMDMDDHEQLLAYIETQLGEPPGPDVESTVLGMASEGRNWHAIVNTVLAHQRR